MGLVQPGIGLMIWMTVAFLTVMFILAKFAWKPILDTLKNREKAIEDALLTAEKTKEEMVKLQAGNEKLLKEARDERDKLIKEANEIKNNIIKEAKENAKEQANKIIAAAKIEITNEKAKALKEVKTHVAEISVGIAEKILKRQLDNDKEQHNYASSLLKEINFN